MKKTNRREQPKTNRRGLAKEKRPLIQPLPPEPVPPEPLQPAPDPWEPLYAEMGREIARTKDEEIWKVLKESHGVTGNLEPTLSVSKTSKTANLTRKKKESTKNV